MFAQFQNAQCRRFHNSVILVWFDLNFVTNSSIAQATDGTVQLRATNGSGRLMAALTLDIFVESIHSDARQFFISLKERERENGREREITGYSVGILSPKQSAVNCRTS